MSAKKQSSSGSPGAWIHSTRLHLLLYASLLVATPFVMLQSFLQEAIGAISRFHVDLAGVELPIVPGSVMLLGLLCLLLLRSRLTRRRIMAAIAVLLMATLAQQIADFYLNHRFYDLQQNWHYIAYGLFAWLVHRDLVSRGQSPARIILSTFLVAILLSTFDEAFQKGISSRVFDLGDIAKDGWGVVMGLVLIHLSRPLAGERSPLRQTRFVQYLRQPSALLLMIVVLVLLFLGFASLLSEAVYWPQVLLLTSAGWLLFFLIFHLSQYAWPRRMLLLLFLLLVLAQGISYLRFRNDQIVHRRPGLVVYKGIPIPIFDLMLFPDGGFRPVDKKKYFLVRDRLFLMAQRTDIIIIGSGEDGSGGRGFPMQAPHQFNFNRYLERGTQVIILENPEACRLFNRLKLEGKRVLCVLHHEF